MNLTESKEGPDLANETQENAQPDPEKLWSDLSATNIPNLTAEARPNVKKFKKRGRQREDEGSGEQRVSKISTGGWVETISFMPVSQCPPQCPDCPPPSLSPPEV
jgi:hypothetical protein